jgi:LacI family transcriptional regulator
MNQIAERLGVHRSTVSLALRNDPRLPTETRQRVQKEAKKLGYRSNPTVSRLMAELRAGQAAHFRSNLAVLDFGNDPSTTTRSSLLPGVKSRAKTLGYGVELFPVDSTMPLERLEQILLSRGVQGVMILSIDLESLAHEPIWSKFSYCAVGIRSPKANLHYVADDNYLTAMTAVRNLRQLGFSRIGFAVHAGIDTDTEHRFVGGYLAAYVEAPGETHPPHLMLKIGERKKFMTWFRRVRPQVIICMENEIRTWLHEGGFRVPDDVSLVHLDSMLAGPEWAGMEQDRFQLGVAAVDIVASQINYNQTGPPACPRSILIQSSWRTGKTLGVPVTLQ